MNKHIRQYTLSLTNSIQAKKAVNSSGAVMVFPSFIQRRAAYNWIYQHLSPYHQLTTHPENESFIEWKDNNRKRRIDFVVGRSIPKPYPNQIILLCDGYNIDR